MADAKRDANAIPTLLAVSNADGITPVPLWADPTTHRLLVSTAGGGTVTSVSVVTANGFSGSVANATTTPAITLSLNSGQITIGGAAGIISDPANFNWFFGDSGNLTASGQYNNSIGYQALLGLTNGSGNMGIGLKAGQSLTSGSYNVSIGTNSTNFNVTGSYNTAIGTNALQGVTGNSFSNNVSIGALSGSAMTTGSNNILLGYAAGNNLTSGSNNIVLGYDIDSPTATNSNTLTIGNLIFATGLTSTGTTISTGKVGIGTSNPSTALEVVGRITASQGLSAAAGNFIVDDSSGVITTYGGASVVFPLLSHVVVASRTTAFPSTAILASASHLNYLLVAHFRVTTSTTHNFTATVAYTDLQNAAQTLTMNFQLVGGTITTAIANANGAVEYAGFSAFIQVFPGSAINVATAGTFTTVTYKGDFTLVDMGF